MPVKGQFYPVNLLGAEVDPNWVVKRFPFTDVAPEVIGKMQAGYLVKFNATLDAVLPALAADDAVLGGVIVDLPDPTDDVTNPTVGVLIQGTMGDVVHYANAWTQGASPTPLSAAAVTRLRDINILIDKNVKAGAFSP
jgi:hypothetical protein